MESATQIVGEEVMYRQEVVADTIASAVWSSDPAGPDLDGQQDSSTDTRIIAGITVVGSFVLTAELVLASGQRRKGQIRVDVVDKIV